MNEIIIQVRWAEQKQYQKIWIDPDYIVLDFIKEMNQTENRTEQYNEVYLYEEKRFLNVRQTLFENQVCPMDHLIMI